MLTHLDKQGKAVMVDVSTKDVSTREAVAAGKVLMNPQTIALILQGGTSKGDVLAVARIAGIMAAKKTADLIPMCHNIPLDSVKVVLSGDPDSGVVEITATVRCTGRTGVEMEALTAVSVAALTVYDMCKAVDKEMVIGAVQLMKKTGGKSGDYERRD